MLHFDNRISIDRPLDDVFAFVADPQNIPEWNYYVANVVPTSLPPRPGTAGATYHQVRRDHEQDLKVKTLEPDRSLVLEAIPPPHDQKSVEKRVSSLWLQAQDGRTNGSWTWASRRSWRRLRRPASAPRFVKIWRGSSPCSSQGL
jgi:uncharacterized protein YndB with AHSA1/START domain